MTTSPLSPSEKKIYNVSELNKEAKNILSFHFSRIQVEGEISNLSTPSSGHIYFTLKDKNAQIRCAMFKSQQRRLKFTVENGKQVVVTAQVSLYEARGDYQLIAERMQLAGNGDLQFAFDQLKNKLQKEGLFDAALKQTIAIIPNKIGIITSPTGAALHDILSVLKRRFPAIPLVIYPTAVQGESAKHEIVRAIELANQQNQAETLILARGGGSLEDLWAFNEECVARAIVNSQLPIISAIGHEVDFTIADFVSDLRAPTPSAAAENAVPDQQHWLNAFQSIESRLYQHIQRTLSLHSQSLNWLSKRLRQQHPGQQLQRHAQTLDNLEIRLVRSVQTKTTVYKSALNIKSTQLQRHNPLHRILRYKEQLHYLNNRLQMATQRGIDTSKQKYLSLVHTLNAVSPLATLDRGYAIVTKANTEAVVHSSHHLAMNDIITTRLAKGKIVSQIKEVHHD